MFLETPKFRFAGAEVAGADRVSFSLQHASRVCFAAEARDGCGSGFLARKRGRVQTCWRYLEVLVCDY